MDVARPAHYVVCSMQFLLLLSALLSALTGANGVSRHGDARSQQTEAQFVAEAPAERRVAIVAMRPVRREPRPVESADAVPLPQAEPVLAAPLDLVRLNE